MKPMANLKHPFPEKPEARQVGRPWAALIAFPVPNLVGFLRAMLVFV